MDNCIFCKIISGEIPAAKVYEDDMVFCFKDINPVAPTHVLIIPKKHIQSLNHLEEDDYMLIPHVYKVAKEIAKEQGILESGYRIVTNCGESAGQSVFHLHFHLIGGKTLNWP